MNPKVFNNLLFIWLAVLLLLLNLPALSLQSNVDETTAVSEVLRRPGPPVLVDDFEDPKWKYDHELLVSSNGVWKGSAGHSESDESDRGDPAILERVAPHKNGISGSTGALKIGTNIPDNDKWPRQDDIRVEFKEEQKYKLRRADQPVFVAHVWLPPFDQWGNYYSFGFRLEAQSNDTLKSYYPSIWLKYNHSIQGEVRIFLRIFDLKAIENGSSYEIPIGSIKQSGWWTLAIAFDEKGVCSYYARSGPEADALAEKNKIFDDTQFMAKFGIKPLLMDHVNTGLFSLGYHEENSKSPIFEIDDYEVWIAEQKE